MPPALEVVAEAVVLRHVVGRAHPVREARACVDINKHCNVGRNVAQRGAYPAGGTKVSARMKLPLGSD